MITEFPETTKDAEKGNGLNESPVNAPYLELNGGWNWLIANYSWPTRITGCG